MCQHRREEGHSKHTAKESKDASPRKIHHPAPPRSTPSSCLLLLFFPCAAHPSFFSPPVLVLPGLSVCSPVSGLLCYVQKSDWTNRLAATAEQGRREERGRETNRIGPSAPLLSAAVTQLGLESGVCACACAACMCCSSLAAAAAAAVRPYLLTDGSCFLTLAHVFIFVWYIPCNSKFSRIPPTIPRPPPPPALLCALSLSLLACSILLPRMDGTMAVTATQTGNSKMGKQLEGSALPLPPLPLLTTRTKRDRARPPLLFNLSPVTSFVFSCCCSTRCGATC